jgi:acyl-coenzyme A thioesterase PaaI-like protein
MSSHQNTKPPVIQIDPDWEVIELPLNIGSGRSMFSGLESADQLRLRVFKRRSDNHLIGRVWFGPGTEGPPGKVHGGAAAYVLDEAMGSSGWMNDFPVVAAKLEFQYHLMTPMAVDLEVEAWITKSSAHRVQIEAVLREPKGEAFVTAKGDFAVLTRAKADAIQISHADKSGIINRPTWKWAPASE